jgi:hypothetical protein
VWLCVTLHDFAWLALPELIPLEEFGLFEELGLFEKLGIQYSHSRGLGLVIYVSQSNDLPNEYKWIQTEEEKEELEEDLRGKKGERRRKTQCEDQPKGLYQISDQSVHKGLKKKTF